MFYRFCIFFFIIYCWGPHSVTRDMTTIAKSKWLKRSRGAHPSFFRRPAAPHSNVAAMIMCTAGGTRMWRFVVASTHMENTTRNNKKMNEMSIWIYIYTLFIYSSLSLSLYIYQNSNMSTYIYIYMYIYINIYLHESMNN